MSRCWNHLESKPRSEDTSLATSSGPAYSRETKFYCWYCKIRVPVKKSLITGRYTRPGKCPKCSSPSSHLFRLKGGL